MNKVLHTAFLMYTKAVKNNVLGMFYNSNSNKINNGLN